MPRTSSAALSLSLPSSDYPHGSKVAVLPATNVEADTLLRSAHRSSFKTLHRLDSLGWLQAAIWHFKTGKGRARQDHQTIFGYGVNVFRNKKAASRALRDVRIHTRKFRVAHLYSRLYQSTDARETLRFVFFAYRDVEVEAYYEYVGVAPAHLAKSLRHTFSRQTSHLAHLSKVFSRLLNTRPKAATPTALPVQTAPDTVSPTVTARPVPTSTVTPTSTATTVPTAQIVYTTPTATSIAAPTATATSLPSATPTATPVPVYTPTPIPTAQAGLAVQATMASPSYPPNSLATVNVYVTKGDQPEAGAKIQANFFFPGSLGTCTAVTDTTGHASCGAFVPVAPNGTQVPVSVQVIGPFNEYGVGSTSFVIQRA